MGSQDRPSSIAMRCGALSLAVPTRTLNLTSCARCLAMADASAILASLDRFIGRLAHQGGLISGHRVATQDGPMATSNILTNQVANHSYHSGHPKQETFTEADHERCASPPGPDEDSGACLARKFSSVGGYGGKSGKCISNQELASDHRQNANGHGGKCSLDQQLAGRSIGLASPGSQKLASPSVTFQSGAAWWRDQYEVRSRHRELGGRRCRAEAELLAWSELQWRWHKQHGERVPLGICGGCWKPIRSGENIPLIDGTYVHSGARHDCLITYGRHWRWAATNALTAMGLMPPPEEPP